LKFILSSENKQIRLIYCQARQHWEVDKEWANCGFTDEMAIEVGGTFAVCVVWRDQDEQWHDDCVGAKKKQGPSVMCWGFIMWNYKGPFYVWEPETKEEREAAAIEIPKLNAEYEAECNLSVRFSALLASEAKNSAPLCIRLDIHQVDKEAKRFTDQLSIRSCVAVLSRHSPIIQSHCKTQSESI
jgi:hypothetical protein